MSIKINKALIKIIKEIPELWCSTANKIYPLIAPKKTTMPYITLVRDGIHTQYTKSSKGFDDVKSIVEIQSKSYPQSVDIASIIIEVLEQYKGNIEGVDINQIRLIDDDEDYIIDKDGNEGFQQTLVFSIKVS